MVFQWFWGRATIGFNSFQWSETIERCNDLNESPRSGMRSLNGEEKDEK